MKPVTAMICLLTIGLSPAMADESAHEADDQIVASFEREFNHEVTAAQPTTRTDIDDDLLYELINKPLRDSEATNIVLVAKNEGGES